MTKKDRCDSLNETFATKESKINDISTFKCRLIDACKSNNCHLKNRIDGVVPSMTTSFVHSQSHKGHELELICRCKSFK